MLHWELADPHEEGPNRRLQGRARDLIQVQLMAANDIHAATMCISLCIDSQTPVQILQSYVLSGGHEKKHTYDQLTSLPEGDEQRQRE